MSRNRKVSQINLKIIMLLLILLQNVSGLSSPSPQDNLPTSPTTTTITTTTTTTSGPPDTTTTTTLQPTIPISMPNQFDIVSFYNLTGKTCCHIQTQCNNCTNFYAVNGITYCCPNCAGVALVTDLKCLCTPSSSFDLSKVRCTLNTTYVVGGYIAWKPSYYSSSGSFLSVSKLFSSVVVDLVAAVVVVVVGRLVVVGCGDF